VNLSPAQLRTARCGASALIVLFAAAMVPGLGGTGLVLLWGGLWLAWAWRTEVPPVLIALLLALALRLPYTAELDARTMAAAICGLAAWTLTAWGHGGPFAFGSGIAWGAAAICAPGLTPVVLAGVPRLSMVHGDDAKHVWRSVLLIVVVTLGAFWWLNRGEAAMFDRFRDSGPYENWVAALSGLFAVERVWWILPWVGVLEVAQREHDDPRTAWRTLAVAGIPASFLFVEPATGLGMVYWVGAPLSAVMLARWTLALPGRVARVVFTAALAVFALQMWVGGGAV